MKFLFVIFIGFIYMMQFDYTMLSNITALLVYVSIAMGYTFEWVKGLALFIALSSITIWISNGKNVFLYYEKLLDTDNKVIIVSTDFLVHFLPLLLVGPPKDILSVLVAFGILLTWYIAFRPRIKEMYYGVLDPEWCDPAIYITAVVTAIIAVISIPVT